jgi:hypothetical protein
MKILEKIIIWFLQESIAAGRELYEELRKLLSITAKNSPDDLREISERKEKIKTLLGRHPYVNIYDTDFCKQAVMSKILDE